MFQIFKDLKEFRKQQEVVKAFKAHYQVTEIMPQVEWLYTSNDGTRWYGYKNPLEVPAYRSTACEAASRWSELCMTPEYFAKKILEIKSHALNKKHERVYEIAVDLEQKATMAAELNTMQILAAQLYFIEGENPIRLTTEAMERKMKIWENDPECEAFFLDLAFRRLVNYTELSKADFINYLRTQAIKEASTKSRLSRALSLK